MKQLSSVQLKHFRPLEEKMREYGVKIDERSEFIVPMATGGFGICSAINFKNDFDEWDGWEHVLLDLEILHRCPTYKEMCKLKDLFWEESEIAFQVHPAQHEYVNKLPYALHLWRYRHISPSFESTFKKKIMKIYSDAQKLYQGKKETLYKSSFSESNGKVVIIFGGNKWPTWEQVCKVKKEYWEPFEAAVQFHLTAKEMLNKEHMIVLLDASDIVLPPKELV